MYEVELFLEEYFCTVYLDYFNIFLDTHSFGGGSWGGGSGGSGGDGGGGCGGCVGGHLGNVLGILWCLCWCKRGDTCTAFLYNQAL